MISKIMCWIGFHDWLCLYREAHINPESLQTISYSSGWVCSRCNKNRSEAWDV